MNSGQKNPVVLADSDVLVPQWPAPAGVRAVFTTRRGGVSAAPWDTLNLGSHVSDEPANVEANRTRLRNYLEQRGARRTVFLDQVHGLEVLRLNEGDEPGDGSCADASLATQPGVACTIMVADCLPVLFATSDGRVVAAAHAGWRGLAGQSVDGGPPQGILEAAVAALRKTAATTVPSLQHGKAEDEPEIIAWLGPCIGPTAFEVSEDVRAAFGPQANDYFKPTGVPGKYWANLPGLARWRLKQAGVSSLHGNDGSEPWCTFSQPQAYFSHRRDAARLGSTGRMAACVWLASD